MAKIKHWQGYGSLDAKKLAEYPYGHGKKKAVILVSGNHEYGVVREDPYDVHRWLCARFVKDCADYRRISRLEVVPFTVREGDGTEADAAVYEIEYWTN